MSDTAVVWFRRDLRLADHPALDHARRHHERVVPVFILDPEAEGRWAPGGASRWWLHGSLESLAGRLHGIGSRLTLAQGDSLQNLQRICRATGARTVCFNRLYEPAMAAHDRRLARVLEESGVSVKTFNGSLLFEPWELVKADGDPYRVFTPFWRRMQTRWRPPAGLAEPRSLPGPESWPESLLIDQFGLRPLNHRSDDLARYWQPGEPDARRRLARFIDEVVGSYRTGRDRPDQSGTSRLSPSLHFGELSPVRVARALDESGQLPVGQGAFSFLGEIAWREFSHHLLWHFPETPERSLKDAFAHFPWRPRSEYAPDLEAWKQGYTGIPMVDAGMRELLATGWMHNRVRMITASFLTKNLRIPWQEGAGWFWETLVDADLANNTQGWQWTAGCGADAAPYFRIFNPVLQGQKFDPDGEYVRRWCPELAGRETRAIHKPLDESEARVRAYPPPRVELAESRRRALAAWERIRGS